MAEKAASSALIKQNLKNVMWSEVVGSAVSLASVFVARKLMPEQTEQLTSRLSHALVKNNRRSPQQARENAEHIIDVVLMNLGGVAGMLTQFTLRRMNGKGQKPLHIDLAALLLGRIGGTSTMAAGLYTTEKFAQTPLRASEATLAKGIHRLNAAISGKRDMPVSADEQRAAYVVVSNVLQSLFAAPGNTLAQTFVDREIAKRQAGNGQVRG